MHVDPSGWLIGARQQPSPNCDARPPGVAAELLVLHNISLPPGQFGTGQVQRLLTNRLDPACHPFFALLQDARVSAHFLIERDGALTQFVSVHQRAWHAGASRFNGRERCNDFSIGIELEGTDFTPFTDPQYQTLAALTRALRDALPLAAVRGHSDLAPARKTDPGPGFDWTRFAHDAQLPLHWLAPAR
jgi:AmpD protein